MYFVWFVSRDVATLNEPVKQSVLCSCNTIISVAVEYFTCQTDTSYSAPDHMFVSVLVCLLVELQ